MLKNKLSIFNFSYRVSFVMSFLLVSGAAFAQGKFVYDAKNSRNPFIPLVTQEGAITAIDREEGQAKFLIEGIVHDNNGGYYAVVNDTVVGVGDSVTGYKVVNIEENKITFEKDGQTFEVVLKREDK